MLTKRKEEAYNDSMGLKKSRGLHEGKQTMKVQHNPNNRNEDDHA